jgi:hypothetical protein
MLSTAMEQFFTATRPLRYDLFEDPSECNEVQLAVSVEDFLAHNWGWKDLRTFLTADVTPKVLWITDNSFLAIKESGPGFDFNFDEFNGYVFASFQETPSDQGRG